MSGTHHLPGPGIAPLLPFADRFQLDSRLLAKITQLRNAAANRDLRPLLKERESACRPHTDPIADWRGHLPLSGYYPCAGTDWSPIQAAASIDTWVFADYAPFGLQNPREPLKTWLSNPPEGLSLELLIEDVSSNRLSDWADWPYLGIREEGGWGPMHLEIDPVAMFALYRRADGRPVRLMYLIGEATATLLAIYGRESFTPWMLCLIQMGYALGGGWDRFFDPLDSECAMRHALRLHPAGMSPLILSNHFLPPEEFQAIEDCERILGTRSESGLDLRKTHDLYCPRIADQEMLARLFPGLCESRIWRNTQ